MIRHSGVDAWVLHEIFGMTAYAPPAPVAQILNGLGREPTVVDLGGNIGLFTLFISQLLPGSQGVVYEPDPGNSAVLEECLRLNDLDSRWQLIRACAGTTDGEIDFLAGHDAVSRRAEPGAGTIRVPVADVLGQVCAADLAKIDIEGSEWDIVLDERFARRPPKALVVEFHPEGCPDGDPRQAMLERLHAVGYRTQEVDYKDESVPADQGVFWAWRDS